MPSSSISTPSTLDRTPVTGLFEVRLPSWFGSNPNHVFALAFLVIRLVNCVQYFAHKSCFCKRCLCYWNHSHPLVPPLRLNTTEVPTGAAAFPCLVTRPADNASFSAYGLTIGGRCSLLAGHFRTSSHERDYTMSRLNTTRSCVRTWKPRRRFPASSPSVLRNITFTSVRAQIRWNFHQQRKRSR